MAVNQQKVDLKKIIDEAVSRFIEIRESDEPQKRKTENEKRLAKHIQTTLYGDGRKNASSKVKLTTFNRYMTTVRKAIAETGYTHHKLDDQLKKVAKKNAEHSDRILNLSNLPLLEVRVKLAEWKGELDKLFTSEDDNKSSKAKELYNAISDINPNPAIFAAMALKDADKKQFTKHQSDKVDEKQSALVEIELEDVKSTAAKLMATPDGANAQAELMALGVAIAVGRRQVEICLQGEFKAVRGNAYMIKFEGQAKAKGKTGAYNIPTIAPASDVLAAIRKLRKLARITEIEALVNEMPEADRNTKFNNLSRSFTLTAKEQLTQAFGIKPRGANWMFKDSRAIYAKTAYLLYQADQEKQGKPVAADDKFFTDNLGHTDKDAQKAYKAFNIKCSNGATRELKNKPAIKKTVRTPAKRLTELKQFAKSEAIVESKAMTNYMAKLVPLIAEQPELEITQSWLRKEVKGKAVNLKKLYEMLDAELLIRI